jgi:hypothetical protein
MFLGITTSRDALPSGPRSAVDEAGATPEAGTKRGDSGSPQPEHSKIDGSNAEQVITRCRIDMEILPGKVHLLVYVPEVTA